MVCNLIVFPVNFAIMWVFRKVRPKNKRKSRITQALQRQDETFKRQREEEGLPFDGPSPCTSTADLKPILEEHVSPIMDTGYTKPLKPAAEYDTANPRDPTTINVPTQEEEKVPIKKKKKFSLPWWFLMVGWVLLWVATLLSAFFVIMYGITFGDLKTKKWITSLFITFLTSIFLTQPIKVWSSICCHMVKHGQS